jgi:hypothetical protein
VRHVLHEARPDRIGNVHEDNWNSARGLLHCAHRYAANAQDYVGSERGKLCGVTAKAVDIATDLTAFDLEIAAALPPQLFKGFLQDYKPNLCLRIVLSKDVEDTDEAHALTLLRTRRHRPYDRAAQQSDECTPPHRCP